MTMFQNVIWMYPPCSYIPRYFRLNKSLRVFETNLLYTHHILWLNGPKAPIWDTIHRISIIYFHKAFFTSCEFETIFPFYLKSSSLFLFCKAYEDRYGLKQTNGLYLTVPYQNVFIFSLSHWLSFQYRYIFINLFLFIWYNKINDEIKHYLLILRDNNRRLYPCKNTSELLSQLLHFVLLSLFGAASVLRS